MTITEPGQNECARSWWARLAAGAAVVVVLIACVAGAVGMVAGRGAVLSQPTLSIANPRVVVLKSQRRLHLLDGDALVRSYAIDLGSVPDGQKVRGSDGRTPVGSFRVVTKNAESRYGRFLGIDYPDANAVEHGLSAGLISLGEASSILAAHADGRCPDWGTALGGGIGIHGQRMGRDWTAGCIALSDEHVVELFDVLRIGDPVEILP
ncbi:MAG: L,D-transpeptidase [Phycisphaerales bacterium]|nr:MAG: L,D-transpeptidase [Phycisphaerales bacterium]